MPSSIGHGLAGLSVAYLLEPLRSVGGRRGFHQSNNRELQSPRARVALTMGCVVLAGLPDVDVLFGVHRGPTHSLGAVLLVVIGSSMLALMCRLPVRHVATAFGAAYASHLLLDWLGKDSAMPRGIMLFWPWSSAYYSSGADLFPEISRRYWKPDEFLFGNLRSIGWEVVLLLPLVVLAYWWGRRRRRLTTAGFQTHDVRRTGC